MHTGWYERNSEAMNQHNPELTRRKILDAAFQEIYRKGFQSASLDKILSNTGVTKGALYHHFPNKSALGYAVVDEIIGQWMRERWVEPLSKTDDPVLTIQRIVEETLSRKDEACHCELGCPLNNLAQEMSSIDEGFRLRIQKIFDEWRNAITGALKRGQLKGNVQKEIKAEKVAAFLQASFEGCVGIAKSQPDPVFFQSLMGEVIRYVENLRPQMAKGGV